VSIIAARLNRIKPSPSSMASQRARELRAATLEERCRRLRLACEALR